MARPKGTGLDKDDPFTLRFEKEGEGKVRTKVEFTRRATKANLSMNEFAIRKIFDEPLPGKPVIKKMRGRPSKRR